MIFIQQNKFFFHSLFFQSTQRVAVFILSVTLPIFVTLTICETLTVCVTLNPVTLIVCVTLTLCVCDTYHM